MRMTAIWPALSAGIFLISFNALAQTSPTESFQPLHTPGGTMFRSASGAPGPAYWQNQADYLIHARLNEKTAEVSGKEIITYTNNSPNDLDYVWLRLDQNRWRKDSRSAAMSPDGKGPHTQGYQIESVSIIHNGSSQKADYVTTDTRMQIRLPAPLKARSGVLKIEISYSFEIPEGGNGRLGRQKTKDGEIFEVAQWYPRMAVYDAVRGWDTLPFLGSGEFYLDYGDIDYTVNVPADMIVVGAGQLQNPKDVLTDTERDRLADARKSDDTVMIREPSDVGEHRDLGSDRLSWHFTMHNTRDVAWAASKAFVWDAARINLPDNRHALAMSAYPKGSAGDKAWGRSTEFLKRSVEIFSNNWFAYPYPTAVNVGGPVGGMEYPGFAFCHELARGASLWGVTAHEIGHTWFPMIVGSNERRNAWMDEGFNTFIDIFATEDFNKGKFAPKSDIEWNPKGNKSAARGLVPYLRSPESQPIMTPADAIPHKTLHDVEYYKTAMGLMMLRRDILGPKRFDYAFRTYIRRWAFKHPTPMDFFRTIDDAAGEDLSWFWKAWFIHDWKLDQAIADVTPLNGRKHTDTRITIRNQDRMVMPVTLAVTDTKGKTQRISLPVEIWENGSSYSFPVKTDNPIAKIEIDPDQHLPDVNATNNTWTAPRYW